MCGSTVCMFHPLHRTRGGLTWGGQPGPIWHRCDPAVPLGESLDLHVLCVGLCGGEMEGCVQNA